ncbi:MAG: hypothetical protein D9V44_08455 [Actinobacteria bacterium]|nr:MAG: hypothetical protein D9V44_08455 [Actinomycetota bacterium]
MRKPQSRAHRGSQRWLQEFVAKDPATLDAAIGLGPLTWVSPLATDEYAEYRVECFLTRLWIEQTVRSLDSFWPTRGPVWDGLALTESGQPVLIEAKAHAAEMASTCAAAAPASLRAISAAFDETKAALGVDASHDWLKGFYQYANRLAHVYLLNELNHMSASLVFVYFVGDDDMRGPASREEWQAVIADAHEALGVSGRLPEYVRDAFVDVPHA